MMATEADNLGEYLNEKAASFDALCEKRHQEGVQEYGELTFLGNDVVRMMIEELADTVNYCRMQAIKLFILQEHLEAELGGPAGIGNINDQEGQDLQIGFDSFKGTKDVGWGQ